MSRPSVTYNMNGEVVLSDTSNGMVIVMRMTADRADELATQLQNMAISARKVQRKKANLHEIIGGMAVLGQNAIDFDAKQIKERAAGSRVDKGENGG